MKLYVCEVCGSIIDIAGNIKSPVSCCGRLMKRVTSNPIQDSIGRHAPICFVHGNTVSAAVSSIEHPMDEEHYIKWIAIETEKGQQCKVLKPSEHPFAQFTITDDDNLISVSAFCNRHGLWRYDLTDSKRGDSVWKCYSA